MSKCCWFFPGQGTQRRGMGAELFPLYPGLVQQADDILGYSIVDICLNDPDNALSSTEYCQPALFIVNCLEFLQKRRHEPWPDYISGHSLGEYNALFAAGVFDFATGVRLVKARAYWMAKNGTGSMLAVIGMEITKLKSQLLSLDLSSIDIANYNLPTQTVVSGPDEDIIKLTEHLAKFDDVRAVHLHVGGAFHSRYAQEAANGFNEELDKFELNDPRVVTVSSVTAKPISPGTVRSILKEQILRSVMWVDTMKYLRAEGVSDAQQIGPGRVLNGLWERSQPIDPTSQLVRV